MNEAMFSEIRTKVGLILGFVYLDGVMDGATVQIEQPKEYRGVAEKAHEIHALYADALDAEKLELKCALEVEAALTKEVERLRATIARVEAVCNQREHGSGNAPVIGVDEIRAAVTEGASAK